MSSTKYLQRASSAKTPATQQEKKKKMDRARAEVTSVATGGWGASGGGGGMIALQAAWRRVHHTVVNIRMPDPHVERKAEMGLQPPKLGNAVE